MKREGSGVKRGGFWFQKSKNPTSLPLSFLWRIITDNTTLHEQGNIKHVVFYGLRKAPRVLLHTLDDLEGVIAGQNRSDFSPNRYFYPHNAVEFSSFGHGLKILTAPHTVCATLKEMTKPPDPIFSLLSITLRIMQYEKPVSHFFF